jgi:hypothetical protein
MTFWKYNMTSANPPTFLTAGMLRRRRSLVILSERSERRTPVVCFPASAN